MKDGSLSINTLPSHNCLCQHRNVFQKGANNFIFCQKAQNFVYFVGLSNNFVQNLPACGPNTYQIMYGETLDFQRNVGVSNGNIKCPIGKSFCAINFPLKLLSAIPLQMLTLVV